MKKCILLTIAVLMCTLSINAQNLHTLEKELPCLNKTFSVNFHVTLDSLRETSWTVEAMEAQIDITNQYFSPICIKFELCNVDTLENWSWDSLSRDYRVDEINRLFYEENRINIYLVDRFDDPTLCGFASGLGVSTSMIYLSGGCLPHEMGHLFGLPHTFAGSGVENVDGSNCDIAGDLICDTPADPYVEDTQIQWLGENCEFIFTGTDINGEFYQPDVGNIMSYYGCDCGFTRGQYIKMANTWLNSDRKMW
ncbi:MAG: M43 family zinc metalloprotease [Saprospiraceae bacterium]|jgi:hypothetical protein|tara:strand:+ start:8288 stop:9043 length:756 start_codon:yes stop_codon:yes gene_type:complete